VKDHLRNTLLEPRNRIGPTLDARVVRGLIDQHLAGRRDHGFLLWKLMQLSMWMNEYDVACA
jgi:hypothetical protein